MKVLFLCTANSCRSILSEAAFNHLAPAGMRAYSAGIDTTGLASKGNEAHLALAPDYVISVCGRAAQQPCPAYFGSSTRLHWGLDDPAEVQGSRHEVEAAFAATLAQIERRLQVFFALPFGQQSPAQLLPQLLAIGELP